MAIDRQRLEKELLLTSGEYFNTRPEIINGAVTDAINLYSSLVMFEDATFVVTADGQLTYDLPANFKSLIDIYPAYSLYASMYQAGFIEWDGSNYYSNLPKNTTFMDVLMDKMEYWRLVDIQTKVSNWKVDETEKTLTFASVPDPYVPQETYVVSYNATHNTTTIPLHHYEHLFKLASSFLLEKQAFAMSKITQTSGPGLQSSFVQPQVVMEISKTLRAEVINRLSTYLPERG